MVSFTGTYLPVPTASFPFIDVSFNNFQMAQSEAVSHRNDIALAYSQTLSESELRTCDAITRQSFVLAPHDLDKAEIAFDSPPISFTIEELSNYLREYLLNTDNVLSSPYLTGGAASHVLTGLEYADLDICFYSHYPCYREIENCLVNFFHEKLHKFDKKPRTHSHIDRHYLGERKTDKTSYSYFGINSKLQLKFIFDFNHCRTVTASDGFHIELFGKNNVFCIDRNKPCDKDAFHKGLIDLQLRIMDIADPYNVMFLVFRLAHKATQGFDISTKLIEASLTRLVVVDFPFPKEKISFKEKFKKHLHNHYFANEDVANFDYLNFIFLLSHMKNNVIQGAYVNALIGAWQEKYPVRLKVLSDLIKDNVPVNETIDSNYFNSKHIKIEKHKQNNALKRRIL